MSNEQKLSSVTLVLKNNPDSITVVGSGLSVSGEVIDHDGLNELMNNFDELHVEDALLLTTLVSMCHLANKRIAAVIHANDEAHRLVNEGGYTIEQAAEIVAERLGVDSFHIDPAKRTKVTH